MTDSATRERKLVPKGVVETTRRKPQTVTVRCITLQEGNSCW
jgi:hypothetical protein